MIMMMMINNGSFCWFVGQHLNIADFLYPGVHKVTFENSQPSERQTPT